MLCRFLFRNFRSYRDETVLDMQAANIPEFSDALLKGFNDNKSFLPVSVIYGPNGGGKSNVLKAFSALVSIVQTPISVLDRESKTEQISPYKNTPFDFDELSKKGATYFEVYFRVNSFEYRYTISVKESGIESESLYRKEAGSKKISLIFDRNESGINFGTGLKKAFANLAVNPDMPLLSFLAITTGIEAIKDAAEWFRGCISVNYNIEESENFFYLNNDDNMKKLIISMLNEMDIGVTDYYFRDTDKKLTPHQIIIKRQFDGKEYEMPLSNESEGTKKLFSFLPQVVSAINDGRIIIVDELDAKLHPKLLKHIIMLFKNPQINKKNAQLIFTSHDLATMRNDVFRRDEIWFAEKNTQGISMLYSLYDIRNDGNKHIKSTAEFAKQYLEGRYGADPYLEKMKSWEV